MSQVFHPPNWSKSSGPGMVDSSGGPPHDGDMDDRVKKLEEFVDEARTELRGIDVRLTKIESRLDQTATKADVTDAINGQIKWIVGTAIGLAVAGITVMTFVLNNAVPKAASSPPTPIVITVPYPAPAAAQPATQSK